MSKAYQIPGFDTGIKIRRKEWKKSSVCYCVDRVWKYSDNNIKESDLFQYIWPELIICDDWEIYVEKPELTKEEIFFNEVKGKRIRWSTWDKNSYFVPETQMTHSIYGKGKDIHSHRYDIENGFKKNIYNEYWEYFLEPTPKKTITLYRYTYQHCTNNDAEQSSWTTKTYYDFQPNVQYNLLKREQKEVKLEVEG